MASATSTSANQVVRFRGHDIKGKGKAPVRAMKRHTKRKQVDVYSPMRPPSPRQRVQAYAVQEGRRSCAPVHIHLRNINFVAPSAPAREPTETEQWHNWIKSFRSTKPWAYWPMIVVFRITMFLLDRVGLGIRLN